MIVAQCSLPGSGNNENQAVTERELPRQHPHVKGQPAVTTASPAFSTESCHFIFLKACHNWKLTDAAVRTRFLLSATDIDTHDNTLIAYKDQHLCCEHDPPQPSIDTNSKQMHNHSSVWCTTTGVGFMHLPTNNVRSVRLSWMTKING